MGLLDYLWSNGILPDIQTEGRRDRVTNPVPQEMMPQFPGMPGMPGIPNIYGRYLSPTQGDWGATPESYGQSPQQQQPDPQSQPPQPAAVPSWAQQPQAAGNAIGMPSGSYGMGGGNQPMQNIPVFGQPAQQFAQPPQQDNAQLPPNARAATGFVAPPTAQLPEPTAGDRALGAFKGFASGRGLLPAISGAVEGYRQGNVNDVERALISRGVDPATAKAAGTSPQLLQAILPRLFETKAPQFTKIGTDAMGREQYGFADANTQTVKPITPNGASGGLSPGVDSLMQAGLRGEEFLKGVQSDPAYGKGTANTVQMMVAGKLAPPSSFALAKPYWQTMIQLASQYDPGFDATLWASRNKARSEFNAGGPNSPAGMITAGNTAIQHLGALSDAAEKLGNFSGIPFFNKTANELRNYAKESSGSAQDIKAFEAIRNKYVEEATKFYRGTGGSEAGLKRDIDALNSAGSPKELRAAIGASAELMQSKINALQERWKQSLGPGAGEFPIIHDKSAGELAKIRGRSEGEGEGPSQKNIPRVSSPAEAAKLPKGYQFYDPNGVLRTVPR